jgi:glycosyltransferase involved in cell wall biosynthesis
MAGQSQSRGCVFFKERLTVNVGRVSVLICTYNRADLLRQTLNAFSSASLPDACDVEYVIVDNNSTDATPEVVQSAAESSRCSVVYVRESRQGKSFALNTGLAHATGDILALTDDDVVPAQDWLVRIVAAFRERDITFAFGKVLPKWECVPPPELLTPRAQDIWGPLAIVDYGDEPTEYRAGNVGQRLPVGANLAFARRAIADAGGWRTDLGKAGNTLISGEDHEIFMRLRRLGLYAGFYDPQLVVRHHVPTSRLTRAYFRRWFLWHGKTHALMLDDLLPDLDMKRVPRIGGVPRFVYRQGLEQFVTYLKSLGQIDPLETLIQELRVIQYIGLFTTCWRRALQNSGPQSIQACQDAATTDRLHETSTGNRPMP